MKVADLAARRKQLSPLKAKVLGYLEGHPEDVFPYRDEALARAVDAKVSAVSFTLWALHKEGYIDRAEVDGKVYLGSRRAITDLKARLGIPEKDPFAEARAIRDRISARSGDIDVVALLDEVRGSWK
jgi:hypothetical protein